MAGLRHHGEVLATEQSFAQDVEADRSDQHDTDESVREGIASDVLDPVENLNGSDSRIVEHQRRAQFSEGPDEDYGAPGE